MSLPQVQIKDLNFGALRVDTLIPKTLLSKLPFISYFEALGDVSEIRKMHVSSLSGSQGWRRIERHRRSVPSVSGGLVEVSLSLSPARTVSWVADFLASSFHLSWHFFLGFTLCGS